MGTVARIVKLLKMGEDNYSLVVQGLARFRVMDLVQEAPYLKARVEPVEDKTVGGERRGRGARHQPQEAGARSHRADAGAARRGHRAGGVASPTPATWRTSSPPTWTCPLRRSRPVLETVDLKARMKLVLELLNRKREILKLSNKIDSAVKGEMSKTQREYYLRQQLKAIKEELGEMGEEEEELDELQERLKKAGLPPDVEKVAQKELNRLKTIPAASSEYTVARTYLDWIADLPWAKMSEDNLDIENARADPRHRPLRHQEGEEAHPGVPGRPQAEERHARAHPLPGRSSGRGQDVARPVDRQGHRPQVRAPVAGRRARRGGDPRPPAHLRRRAPGPLHPEHEEGRHQEPGDDARRDRQARRGLPRRPVARRCSRCWIRSRTTRFSDHYLDVAFDLSKVMFIATANQLDPIPGPLRDRMEIIELSGYTFEEKQQIARIHLIPKQLKEHGLTAGPHRPSTTRRCSTLITAYTREAGVRNLERRIADVCRAVAVEVAGGKTDKQTINAERVKEILGPETLLLRGRRAHRGSGRGHRPRLDGGGRRPALHRGHEDGRQGRHDPHRPARRRDEGVRARRRSATCAARRTRWASTRTSSRRRTCTCTSRRAPSPRTVPRRA